MRANVLLYDDKVVGVIGVTREPEYGVFFSDIAEGFEWTLTRMPALRAIKDSLRYVRMYKGPVLSVASHAEGCRVLHKLGFTHLHGAWYGWLR